MKHSTSLSIFLFGLCLIFSCSGIAAVDAPVFNGPPEISGVPLVGSPIGICVVATDPQGLPLTYTFHYGDNSSDDTLGKHTYTSAGDYVVTVTVSNGTVSATAEVSVNIKGVANLWIKRQTVSTSAAGKQAWHARYIYNTDRTLANIFNPATEDFVTSLGSIPIIQITNKGNSVQKFSGSKPTYKFKSITGAIPSISVVLNERNQTIAIDATSETITDKVPGVFHNAVQVGASNFALDQAFDAKGKFTANAGYRSAAFVVSAASIKAGNPGKDTVALTLFLGDPTFTFPGASGANTIRIRVTNVVDQIVLDKNLTDIVAFKAGKFKSGRDTATPTGTFTYDSIKGNVTFRLSKATLFGLLTTSEENVRVDVTMGDQTYTTRLTLFAARAGSYSALLPANFVNFIPGRTPNTTTPPTVISTNPTDGAMDVAINHTMNATFDKDMDCSTITASTFTLEGPGPNFDPVNGTVSYDAVHRIATFTPGNDLASDTQYRATVTTGVKDLNGNALAVNKVWTFTTGKQQALVPVPLGMASTFGSFGGGAGMTSQGLFTVVNGDISTTGASTTVTGFHDSVGDIYTETPLNKGRVSGRIYTAPPTPGGAGVGGNASTFAIATQGANDAQTAYDNLSPASLPGGTDPGTGQLGGLTLPPGVYKASGGSFQITGSDLTLDAQGDTNATWVFQMASSLTVGGPGAPRSIILINGAKAKNVFWQVGSAATINAAGGGTMVGTIIAYSGVTFSTAGNVTLVTLNGRALGLHASTTLVNTVINVPAP